MSALDRPSGAVAADHVFPPHALRMLRDQVTSKGGYLANVTDDVLAKLLTTIFWAALETYEGEHHPIGVVFLGTSNVDFVFPEGANSESAPLYQWKVLRFEVARPLSIGELVKLAVGSSGSGLYTAVNMGVDGSLVIAGLIREGFNTEPDPFVTIVAPRPGCLSIHRGGDLLLGYERGVIVTGEGVWFVAGTIRRSLERLARAAGLDDEAVSDYVRAMRSLVGHMTSHGRGGILVISYEDEPEVAARATYRMRRDSSLASLLRLARRVGRAHPVDRPAEAIADDLAFHVVLRNAFLAEAERVTQELAALTAIDGAVVLNGELALLGFGVVLPVGIEAEIVEALDADGIRSRDIDLSTRGTRHRASAMYAAGHPGSLVFVASEDGQLSCFLRHSLDERTLLWRLGTAGETDGAA
jgi:DisA bacterial checkpoint controller nucleotide-binding